jgi:hypothetical protein
VIVIVMGVPIQAVDGPVTVAVSGLSTVIEYVVDHGHPSAVVSEYVITALPTDAGVTTPVALIEATEVGLMAHIPEAVALV